MLICIFDLLICAIAIFIYWKLSNNKLEITKVVSFINSNQQKIQYEITSVIPFELKPMIIANMLNNNKIATNYFDASVLPFDKAIIKGDVFKIITKHTLLGIKHYAVIYKRITV